MIADPASVKASGTSPNTSQPSATAHTIMVYWYGTTMLAAASLSERLTQANAAAATTPSSIISAKSPALGPTQPSGATTPLTTTMAPKVPLTITTSEVPRSMRVMIRKIAKKKLPASAISAGKVNVAAEGRSAINTPAKPTATALQRRQPTCSPRKSAESAVT